MPIQQSTNPQGGIFQNIVELTGTASQVASAQGAMASFSPYITAVYQAIQLLPEGELKEWMQLNAVDFWKRVIKLITGRKYTKGDYTLAERLNDQVYCRKDIGQTQASDELVEQAHRIFNQLFGVRIATVEDLDALDFGIAAYKNRAVSQGISQDAIERAVFLKQRFYPISTYNTTCWNLKWFEVYPLVDRIPDYNIGKWYSGPLIGGPTCVDGVIPVEFGIVKQIIGGDFDPATGNIIKPDGTVIKPGEEAISLTENPIQNLISYVKSHPLPVAVIGAAVGYALYEMEG